MIASYPKYRFQDLLSEVFAELGAPVQIGPPNSSSDSAAVEVVRSDSGESYHFEVVARQRVTPQIADDLFRRVASEGATPGVTRVVFAPVISDRVAQMARARRVSYLDYAGNCYLVDPQRRLLVSRSGIKNEENNRQQPVTDIFSPKSSRIVRAMLHAPAREWQLTEIAIEAVVSAGLAHKVKQALVVENYAQVQNRRITLKDPAELLAQWTRHYPGAAGERQFYVRGDVLEIESRITEWCERNGADHALARFSAAWRLAPEVRYSVASLYLGDLYERPDDFARFRAECELKEVDSGGNLALLVPYDESVFVKCTAVPERTTSALQAYLDLNVMSGRAEAAAERVYEKHLRPLFEASGVAS